MDNKNKLPEATEPSSLTASETENPAIVIIELFDASSIEHLRIDLWQYFKASTVVEGWWWLSQHLNILLLQTILEKLMDASWLLLQRKEEKDGEVPLPIRCPASADYRAEALQMRRDYKKIQASYSGNICQLLQKEIDNPYLVLKGFFSTLPLHQWKSLLNDWTEFTLCSTSLLEVTDDYNHILYYEQLEKLLEAAYCMHNSLDKNNGDLKFINDGKI